MGEGSSSINDMSTPMGKIEQCREGSVSSLASSPDGDTESYAQEHIQTQKRKGGRKPIYATSEERKQRNRQAQAAFRERRTEYIKQLENTIKQCDQRVQALQQTHRVAAEECLMLKYRNSLLERILLEKGIDAQAEIQARTGSPQTGPIRSQDPTVSPAHGSIAVQQAVINERTRRMSSVGLTPKLEGIHGIQQIRAEDARSNISPCLQPAPASHASSPSTTTTQSPNFISHCALSSPNMIPLAQAKQRILSQHQPRPHFSSLPPQPSQRSSHPASNHRSGSISAEPACTGPGGPSNYFQSPYHNHLTQLEREYNDQANDEHESGDLTPSPGQYPPSYNQQMPPPSLPRSSQRPGPNQPVQSANIMQPPANGPEIFEPTNHLYDPYDPILETDDTDPFSMPPPNNNFNSRYSS